MKKLLILPVIPLLILWGIFKLLQLSDEQIAWMTNEQIKLFIFNEVEAVDKNLSYFCGFLLWCLILKILL